jgi:hypothetical protein
MPPIKSMRYERRLDRKSKDMNKSDLEYDEDEERDLVADTDKLMSF